MKVGVIGLGVGEAHVKSYVATNEVAEVYITDLNQQRARDIAALSSKIKIVPTAEELLDIDELKMLSICSYDSYHANQVVTALKKKINVFVEKPLCVYEQELSEIVKTKDENPEVHLSSNLILRKCPRFIGLKSKIESGEFGTLFHIEATYLYGRLHKITEGWRSEEPKYSVILGGGIHMIDLLLWLVQSRVKTVSSFGNKIVSKETKFKGPDNVVSILEFENGMIGKLGANFGCVHPHFHELNVFGSKASFVNRLDAADMYKGTSKDMQGLKIDEYYPVESKGLLLDDFIDSVVSERQPELAAKELFEAMAVAFTIDKAIEASEKLTVNYSY